ELALWIGQPRRRRHESLTADDRAFLRRVARQTWLYFETFVGPEDNWLPPDNFQEDPHPVVAHRTSPTNIGMLFLSSLTAWDLGYLGAPDLAVRVQNGLDALDRLARYRGHWLNWYDSRSLAPLEPRYVSTVDSGNLAACLVALAQGCRQAAAAPVLDGRQWHGLCDTLDLLAANLDDGAPSRAGAVSARLAAMYQRIDAVRRHPDAWHAAMIDLAGHLWPRLEAAIVQAIAPPSAPSVDMLRWIQAWLERVNHHLTQMRRHFDMFFPWLALVEAPPQGARALAAEIAGLLPASLTLEQAGERCIAARRRIAAASDSDSGGGASTAARWRDDLAAAIDCGCAAQAALRQRFLDNAARAEVMAYAMDFKLLYDSETRLFYIGYNVSADRIDPHHYDLLATEARLASYFAIAKRDVPSAHWFHLGRPTSRAAGAMTLLSWNGSMFEYLMPTLLLRSGPDKLLDQSERGAVEIQRRHAANAAMPWGVSESAFAARDADEHYQYRAFGVPGLGMRRGLARDAVVAPYATALALAVCPAAAVGNLRRLKAMGLTGLYGFFDAADFTPERVPAGEAFIPVRTYMAHHQGMILAAIGNALEGDAMVRRFAADKRIRAASLLLQERIPWELPSETPSTDDIAAPAPPLAAPAPHPWKPQWPVPVAQRHLLGNGRFASWISQAGGGGLWWHRYALTRWRPDPTCDDQGLWIYVHDADDDLLWSPTHRPTMVASADADIVFHPHMATFHRRDHGIAIRMEVGVVAGDDLEIRRLTIVNESDRARRLRLTSYGEVALAPPLEDERHPAFAKLFVHSEYVPALGALLFERRSRGPQDQPPVLLHAVVLDDEGAVDIRFETDRRTFLGRNASARRPRGLRAGLSQGAGWTLDPVMALQVALTLAPQERRQLAFVTAAAGSRASVLELAERYTTLASLDWALADAGREAAREALRLALTPEHFPQLQCLASLILSPQPALRAPAAALAANRLGQPRLWALGLSGDFPILLLRMSDSRRV
ncbi:MAG: cellobiose phosphorylase, partial [Alphaproteobacteria bacterium]